MTLFKTCLFAFILCGALSTSSCGFYLQGEKLLPPVMQQLYLQIPDAYGSLARTLKQSLKMSHVTMTSTEKEATATLAILNDDATQQLLSVSSLQQTRQYLLAVTVTFQLQTPAGQPLTLPQTLREERPITIQSNQILSSSNEANLFYQQMRRTLAHAIMNRLASTQIREAILLITKPKVTSPPL